MEYSDYIKESEYENTCAFCGAKCDGIFCSKECKIADLND